MHFITLCFDVFHYVTFLLITCAAAREQWRGWQCGEGGRSAYFLLCGCRAQDYSPVIWLLLCGCKAKNYSPIIRLVCGCQAKNHPPIIWYFLLCGSRAKNHPPFIQLLLCGCRAQNHPPIIWYFLLCGCRAKNHPPFIQLLLCGCRAQNHPPITYYFLLCGCRAKNHSPIIWLVWGYQIGGGKCEICYPEVNTMARSFLPTWDQSFTDLRSVVHIAQKVACFTGRQGS